MNPFDLKNTADLPEEVRNQLTRQRRNTLTSNIEKIFHTANKGLTIDEVIVGYWRLYKDFIPREKITGALRHIESKSRPKMIQREVGTDYYKYLWVDEEYPCY